MALKDKLMTLEDFKTVRDVDVASNTAQFTEINESLDDVKADLNEILEQGILSHFAVDNDGYICQKVEVG